jgi:hypothetical protein
MYPYNLISQLDKLVPLEMPNGPSVQGGGMVLPIADRSESTTLDSLKFNMNVYQKYNISQTLEQDKSFYSNEIDKQIVNPDSKPGKPDHNADGNKISISTIVLLILAILGSILLFLILSRS